MTQLVPIWSNPDPIWYAWYIHNHITRSKRWRVANHVIIRDVRLWAKWDESGTFKSNFNILKSIWKVTDLSILDQSYPFLSTSVSCNIIKLVQHFVQTNRQHTIFVTSLQRETILKFKKKKLFLCITQHLRIQNRRYKVEKKFYIYTSIL